MISKSRVQIVFMVKVFMSICLMVIGGWVTITALKWPLKTALFPVVVGVPVFFMAMVESLLSLVGKDEGDLETKGPDRGLSEDVVRRRTLSICLWILGFFILIVLVGFLVAVPVFFLFYLKWSGKEKWGSSLVLTVVAWGAFYALFMGLLHIPFPEGWIQKWLMNFGIG